MKLSSMTHGQNCHAFEGGGVALAEFDWRSSANLTRPMSDAERLGLVFDVDAKVIEVRSGTPAARLRVDCSARSWQLPTFILFERRKEAKRLPPFDANGEVVKVSIDREGLCACFELDRRMARSSAVDTGNPKKKRGKKKSL